MSRVFSEPSIPLGYEVKEGGEVRMAQVSRLECADALHGIRVVDVEGGSGSGIGSHSACGIQKIL